MTTPPILQALWIYPIKSCGGISCLEYDITARGARVGAIGDRRWMLIDAAHNFITQREYPSLACVKVELHDHARAIRVYADGHDAIVIYPSPEASSVTATIWRQTVTARSTSVDCDAWFSRFLGRDVRLVYQADNDIRRCDPAFAANPARDHVGFADGFPLLVTNLGTLRALAAQAGDTPIRRFRPNLVIDNASDKEECTWQTIAIGAVEMALVKPCTRCVVTTIDPDSGIKTGPEPLKTLARMSFLRQSFGDVLVQGAVFGENAISLTAGHIAVGMRVEIRATKPLYAFKPAPEISAT